MLVAQQAHARRVEGRHPHAARVVAHEGTCARRASSAAALFVKVIAKISLARAPRGQQVGDAVREDTRLAGSLRPPGISSGRARVSLASRWRSLEPRVSDLGSTPGRDNAPSPTKPPEEAEAPTPTAHPMPHPARRSPATRRSPRHPPRQRRVPGGTWSSSNISSGPIRKPRSGKEVESLIASKGKPPHPHLRPCPWRQTRSSERRRGQLPRADTR